MLGSPGAAPLRAGVVLVVGPQSQQEPAVLKAPWMEMFLLAQLPSGSHSGCWLSPPQLYSSFLSKLFLL